MSPSDFYGEIPVYAVIRKNPTGNRYSLRISQVDDGYTCYASALYGDHFRSRELAKEVCAAHGYIVVRDWKQARKMIRERRPAEHEKEATC